ncbi:hypothetical protein IGL98_001457 [Enterococcus sp. DIV0840]|nr:WxL domain-containing protein [Enterococcus sp. DIV0849a]MBO0434495.1 hypothetical protein [Enterococcus sp. DIV0849a]
MKNRKKSYSLGMAGLVLLLGSLFYMKSSSIKASDTETNKMVLEQTTNQIQASSENELYFTLNVKDSEKDQPIVLDYSKGVSFDKDKILELNKEKMSFIQVDNDKTQMKLTLKKEAQETTLYFKGTTDSKEALSIQASSDQDQSNQLLIEKNVATSTETSTVQSEEQQQARTDISTPYSDEWTEITKAEEASISAGVGKELRYGFGPTEALGTTNISGNRQKQFAIPNVTFMNEGNRVQHIYHKPGRLSKPEEAGQSLWTSYGLIYAYGNNTKPTIFNTGSHITSEGYKYYKRILPNGMTVYKLTYNTAFDSKKFHVEIVMTGKTTGTVNVEYTVTNTGTGKETDFVIGSMIDTELNEDDQVPIYAIGDNKGVYIENTKDKINKYKLQYLFTGPDHVQNWTGKHWIQGTTEFSRDHFLNYFFNYDDSGFSALNSLGYEAQNYPADQLVYMTSDINKMDTAIFMKNQPTSLEANEGTKMAYDVTIGLPGNPPEVFIDQNDQDVLLGNAFDVTGQWRDSESPSVDLYYTVDDGPAVQFGKKVENDLANPGKKIDWKFTLPSSVLTLGKKVIKVYAVDSEGHTSEEKILNLTIKAGVADLIVKFVDEENNIIHPDIKISGKINSLIDLTKENAVVKAINEQLEKKYEITDKPIPENAIEIVEEGRTVTYKFKGRIVLSAPKEIDFGTQIIKAQETVIEEPVRIDGALEIQDSRATKKTWKLKVRMKQELTNSNSEVVTGAIRYIYSGNEIKLNSGMQDVAVGKNSDGSPNKISDKWSAKGDGFKLKTEVGAVKESGVYTGIIEWELFEGP